MRFKARELRDISLEEFQVPHHVCSWGTLHQTSGPGLGDRWPRMPVRVPTSIGNLLERSRPAAPYCLCGYQATVRER